MLIRVLLFMLIVFNGVDHVDTDGRVDIGRFDIDSENAVATPAGMYWHQSSCARHCVDIDVDIDVGIAGGSWQPAGAASARCPV